MSWRGSNNLQNTGGGNTGWHKEDETFDRLAEPWSDSEALTSDGLNNELGESDRNTWAERWLGTGDAEWKTTGEV